MKIKQTIEVLENEKECVRRANICDRNCAKCDLVRPDYEILDAYNTALDWLRKIQLQKGFENV